MKYSTLQHQIEQQLAEREPDVEVLTVDVKGETIELYIDHPEGVTLDICERVTHSLPEIREDYALTVSSPGIERPLARPAHFQRFLGRTVRIRTTEARDGRKTFTGELVGADDSDVTVATDTGVVTIPYAVIHRSNLVNSEI
jgi:ribosome maturation factor RimP